jgi:hypothetical protein
MRKPYDRAQVMELKEAIRTGKPFIQIAEHFSGKWDRSFVSLYAKVRSLAGRTYKIREWDGPKRRVTRPYKKKSTTLSSSNVIPMVGKTVKSITVHKDYMVINF